MGTVLVWIFFFYFSFLFWGHNHTRCERVCDQIQITGNNGRLIKFERLLPAFHQIQSFSNFHLSLIQSFIWFGIHRANNGKIGFVFFFDVARSISLILAFFTLSLSRLSFVVPLICIIIIGKTTMPPKIIMNS